MADHSPLILADRPEADPCLRTFFREPLKASRVVEGSSCLVTIPEPRAALTGRLDRLLKDATGKVRQIQYKLFPGEAAWLLKADKVVEF